MAWRLLAAIAGIVLAGCATLREKPASPAPAASAATPDSAKSKSSLSELSTLPEKTKEMELRYLPENHLLNFVYKRKAAERGNDPSWCGVYATTEESSTYAGKIIEISSGYSKGEYLFRMTSHSEKSFLYSDINEPVSRGESLIDGDALYMATVSGRYDNGAIVLETKVERFTRAEINGKKVLMRDDALKLYREQGKLWDYGILVKVSDEEKEWADLGKVKRPSIKVLYKNPKQEWKDPFVHGPQ